VKIHSFLNYSLITPLNIKYYDCCLSNITALPFGCISTSATYEFKSISIRNNTQSFLAAKRVAICVKKFSFRTTK
jgi:hypothetical protein